MKFEPKMIAMISPAEICEVISDKARRELTLMPDTKVTVELGMRGGEFSATVEVYAPRVHADDKAWRTKPGPKQYVDEIVLSRNGDWLMDVCIGNQMVKLDIDQCRHVANLLTGMTGGGCAGLTKRDVMTEVSAIGPEPPRDNRATHQPRCDP
jgi:hypothetical protein